MVVNHRWCLNACDRLSRFDCTMSDSYFSCIIKLSHLINTERYYLSIITMSHQSVFTI